MPRPILNALHPLGDAAGELVGDRALHDEPVRRRAGLADVAELREHRAVDRLVEVGVVEHDERGVAAELHRGAQHALRRLLEQPLPDLRSSPVNDSLRSRGSRMIGSDTAPEVEVVKTLTTPFGQPGILEQLREVRAW